MPYFAYDNLFDDIIIYYLLIDMLLTYTLLSIYTLLVKMKKTILIVISLVMILATLTVTGCGPAELIIPPNQVTVQLKWIHQAQFAGMYIAEKKSFYAEENIDVMLIPGGPEITDTIIPGLVKGNSEFAIISGDQLLLARSEGEPLVAIAAIFQNNPYVYLTLKDSGIERPQDFAGKKLMISADGELPHTALMNKLGIDPATIEYIPYEREVLPLTSGQIDVYMAYRTGTGLAFDETGYEFNVIWVADYGIGGYADTIVTTEQMVQQNPELVEKFLRATIKGWRYAIENQDEAVAVTMEYGATLNKDRQKRMMTTQTPIIHTGEVDIGWMAQPLNVADAYTMEFLNKIYGR